MRDPWTMPASSLASCAVTCEAVVLAVVAFVLVLALAATRAFPPLALPLFVGAVAMVVVGLRASWRLAAEPDACVLQEILRRAAQESTIDRRLTFAARIRNAVPLLDQPSSLQDGSVSAELVALADELEDPTRVPAPAAGVEWPRLLTDIDAAHS